MQNEDLRQLLLHTKNALLQHFIRGEPPEADTYLMKLRSEIRTEI